MHDDQYTNYESDMLTTDLCNRLEGKIAKITKHQ